MEGWRLAPVYMTFVKRDIVRHVVHVVQNALNGAEWECLVRHPNVKMRLKTRLAFWLSVARLRGRRGAIASGEDLQQEPSCRQNCNEMLRTCREEIHKVRGTQRCAFGKR